MGLNPCAFFVNFLLSRLVERKCHSEIVKKMSHCFWGGFRCIAAVTGVVTAWLEILEIVKSGVEREPID